MPEKAADESTGIGDPAEPEERLVRTSGFPGGAHQISIPALFFSDVLPAITDEAEMRVTLHVFYLLGRKRRATRWLVVSELRGEAPLMRALDRMGGGAEAALRRGLTAALRRGTLLRAVRRREGRDLEIYAVNAPGAAEMLARLAGAAVSPPEGGETAVELPLPNIFVLYEENIGVISPLLAEQLRDAERTYPWPWIEAAFREAVALNRRSWRYIERILERWRTEGPDLEAIARSTERSRRRSLAGRYWRLVRR